MIRYHPKLHVADLLFDLILYVPVNNLSVMSGWVFLVKPVLSNDSCVLLKDTTQ